MCKNDVCIRAPSGSQTGMSDGNHLRPDPFATTASQPPESAGLVEIEWLIFPSVPITCSWEHLGPRANSGRPFSRSSCAIRGLNMQQQKKEKKKEDIQAYHAFIQPLFFILHELSSGVGLVCNVVILELCHTLPVIVLLIILCGFGVETGFILQHVGLTWCKWTKEGCVFGKFINPLGSEVDFKEAWFDLLMINDSIDFGRFCLIHLYFIVCTVQSDTQKDKEKYSDPPSPPQLLWTKGNIIIKLLIFFAQVGMALILLYLLLLCIGTKCTCFILLNLRCSLWCL